MQVASRQAGRAVSCLELTSWLSFSSRRNAARHNWVQSHSLPRAGWAWGVGAGMRMRMRGRCAAAPLDLDSLHA